MRVRHIWVWFAFSLDEKVRCNKANTNTNHFDTQLKIAQRRTQGLGANFYEMFYAKGKFTEAHKYFKFVTDLYVSLMKKY